MVRLSIMAEFEVSLKDLEGLLGNPEPEQRSEVLAILRQTPLTNKQIWDFQWYDIRVSIGQAMLERKEAEVRMLADAPQPTTN